jgi:protoheme IX farnesyltransferase
VVYAASALVLGAILLAGTLRIMRSAEWVPVAWRVYKYSLLYLALLFAAMVVDRGIARG